MSFVKNMKRAFGFGYDDTDEEVYEEEKSAVVTNEKEQAKPNETVQRLEVTDELPLAIFDGVIAVFNEAQPDFIKSCLDIEAQRRYLYQSMDSSLKEYLANLSDMTRQKALQSWAEERTRLQDQLHEMQDLQHRAEESLAEQQQQKLSAQRQKRAFNERICELEKRIAELEAEREQYELETKSLVNKLKVADVKDADLTAQRDEIADLRSRLMQAEATIADQDSKLHVAEETISRQEEQLKAAEAMAHPAEDDQKAMEEIQQRLLQFEDVKRKKDAQIDKQALRISQLESENVSLHEQLKQAVEAKMPESQPDGEKPRRRQRKDESVAPTKRRHKAKISAIDESIDGIEWLLSTPGEDETVSKTVASTTSDSDFGYQPPIRKEIVVDNDAQLSLF